MTHGGAPTRVSPFSVAAVGLLAIPILLAFSGAPSVAFANALDHLRTTDDIGRLKIPHAGVSHILVIPMRVGTDVFPEGELAMHEAYFAPEGGPGTFRQYWLDVSGGRYDPIPTLVAPVLYPDSCPIPDHDLSNCTVSVSDVGLLFRNRIGDTFVNLLERVRDEQNIDLAIFDVNGASGATPDGFFDGVIIDSNIHSGISLPIAALGNEVVVHSRSGGNGRDLEMGMAAMVPPILHEFAHLFGFMDLYGGPSVNDLMEDLAATLAPFSRQQIGWADTLQVDGPTTLVLPPVLDSSKILRIGAPPRYLMIENRGGPLHDDYEICARGLYIYQVDEDELPRTPLGFIDIASGTLDLPNAEPPYLDVALPVGCHLESSSTANACVLDRDGDSRELIHPTQGSTGLAIRRGRSSSADSIPIEIYETDMGPTDAGIVDATSRDALPSDAIADDAHDSTDATGSSDARETSDAGTGTIDTTADTGCGCSTTAATRGPRGVAGVFAALVFLAARRRIRARLGRIGIVAMACLSGDAFAGTTPDLAVRDGLVAFEGTRFDTGDTLEVAFSIDSVATPFFGDVPFRISLSSDATLDPGDVTIHDGRASFSGEIAIDVDIGILVPPLRPGAYFVAVAIDPDGTLGELETRNNTGLSRTSATLRGADLVVASLVHAPYAFVGEPWTVGLVLENRGLGFARRFAYALHFSFDEACNTTDPRAFLFEPLSLDPRASASFSVSPDLGVVSAPATVFVCAVVDVFSEVGETLEGNNVLRADEALHVLPPSAELSGAVVRVPSSAAAGESFSIGRALRNMGVADAASFEYRYLLSGDSAIDAGDVPIATLSGSLAAHESNVAFDRVVVPREMRPGHYFVVLEIDPNDRTSDPIEWNDVDVGPPLQIFGSPLEFTVDALPSGTIGIAYEASVHARHGLEAMRYAVAEGSLPDGLELDADDGAIAGTPEVAGVFEFTVRAASGRDIADRPYAIAIAATDAPIAIASAYLPTAVVGQPYDVVLLASGGTMPYRWETRTPLPSGLSVTPLGMLTGTAIEPGGFDIGLAVFDAFSVSATRSIDLRVVDFAAQVHIATRRLPDATVAVPYGDSRDIRLEASLGDSICADCVWSTVGPAPAGLVVDVDGTVHGTPERVGTTLIVLRVSTSTGTTDARSVILEVLDDGALAIARDALPSANVGSAYQATIVATGGDGPVAFDLVEGAGSLPPGIALSNSGALEGMPTSDGTYAFVARATDARSRSTLRALSLVVRALPPQGLPPEGCGCREVEEGRRSSPWLFALVFPLFIVRRGVRARIALVACLGASIVAAPRTARAQFYADTPYRVSWRSEAYSDLASATVLFSAGEDDARAELALPFAFTWYDRSAASVTVSADGILAFGDAVWFPQTNEAPGASPTIHGFIAPWWDDLVVGASGAVSHAVEGSAPNRAFVLEYRRVARFSSPSSETSFQVRLFEGRDRRVEVSFGDVVGAWPNGASSGAEDEDGARPIFFSRSFCSTDCGAAELAELAGTRVAMTRDPGPDLVAVDVAPPSEVSSDTPLRVAATVLNRHGSPLGPFDVAILARELDGRATTIGSLEVVLAAYERRAVGVPCTFTSTTHDREVVAELVVDPDDAVGDIDTANNRTRASTLVIVRSPRPDLAVENVAFTPEDAEPGTSIEIDFAIRNVGRADVDAVRVGYVLSTNRIPTAEDILLGSTLISLDAGAVATGPVTLRLPTNAKTGTYTLGVVSDLEDVLDDANALNDTGVAQPALRIISDELAIATERLPSARLSFDYVGVLEAIGGTGDFVWEISRGSLPAGLFLGRTNGVLSGRPSVLETQNLTVRVTSGASSAEREYAIVVADPRAPLSIATPALPFGVVDEEYAVEIRASGRDSTSFSWSAIGLPAGLALTPIVGTPRALLAGVPEVTGDFSPSFTAMTESETATRTHALEIRSSSALAIVPRTLSTAHFARAYEDHVDASGGTPPRVFRLAFGALPAGLRLTLAGDIVGTPTAVGSFVFGVEVSDSVAGEFRNVDEESFVLVVLPDATFRIVTEALEPAVVGTEFEAFIAADKGVEPYDWSLPDTVLPAGLVADVDAEQRLRLRGTPTDSIQTNILVRVEDARGRVAFHAYVLDVLEPEAASDDSPAPSPSDRCDCRALGRTTTSAASSLAVLAAFMGGAWAARRRRVGHPRTMGHATR